MKRIARMALVALSLAACTTTYSNGDVAPSEKGMKMSIANNTATSQYDFAETDRRLKQALDSRGLKTFAVVNHGEGAKSVGQDIGMSKLYIFGNPKSGTPLMMDNRKMGLELPMKILIHTEGGDSAVHIAHPDIGSIAKSYGVTGKDELLGKITSTLQTIVTEAGG